MGSTFQISLPKLDNNGVGLNVERESIIREIIEIAGGLTRTEGVGMWVDGSRLYTDEVFTATVFCQEQDQVDELERRVEAWRQLLRQEALAYAVVEAKIRFVSK